MTLKAPSPYAAVKLATSNPLLLSAAMPGTQFAFWPGRRRRSAFWQSCAALDTGHRRKGPALVCAVPAADYSGQPFPRQVKLFYRILYCSTGAHWSGQLFAATCVTHLPTAGISNGRYSPKPSALAARSAADMRHETSRPRSGRFRLHCRS